MKYVNTIINEVREDTENTEFNATIGLSEETFLRYINEAINRLHGKIIAQHADVFLSESTVTCSQNTQSYSVPTNAFNNTMISSVEYSYNGNTDNYTFLKPTTSRNRASGVTGTPSHYIRKGSNLLLVPAPDDTGATLRVTYIRKPIRLDKRRGQIKAVTTAGSNITNLEINYINGNTVDSGELAKRTKCCVVDKYGNIKMDNILISSIDTSATYDAMITVDSGFEFASGETITVDDYIVSGDYTTTHLLDTDFDVNIEDYIRQYAVLRIMQRDSSIDQQEAFAVLETMESQILANFKDLSDDVYNIPNINDEWW